MACLCMMQATAASTSSPVFFTGEMVFPWMFEDLVALQPFKKLAIAVAEADSWSKLYDAAALAETRVPVAAATYCEVRCVLRALPSDKQLFACLQSNCMALWTPRVCYPCQKLRYCKRRSHADMFCASASLSTLCFDAQSPFLPLQDMYVDFNLAQETAAKIAGMRQWMTNEFQHSGLRDDGAVIFEALLSMTRGSRVLF